MDELRRKIVLSTPFLTAGLLTGCGGGGEDNQSSAATSNANGLATAQAVSPLSGQSLLVSALSGSSLDTIWSTTNGGTYLVPTLPNPAIQTELIGTGLTISVVEKFVLSSTETVYRALNLTLNNGTAPALTASYTGAQVSNALVRVLKRTVTGTAITESVYRYLLSAPSSNTGTVKVTSVGTLRSLSYDGGRTQTSVRAFGLTFANLKFNAVTGATTGSIAVNGLQLSGNTTLDVLPQDNVAWL